MNIIITGSSRGIGFEIAKRFVETGNHNIIAISRNESKLKELNNACIRLNIEAHLYPFVLDLEEIDSNREKLLAFIKEKFEIALDSLWDAYQLIGNKEGFYEDENNAH